MGAWRHSFELFAETGQSQSIDPLAGREEAKMERERERGKAKRKKYLSGWLSIFLVPPLLPLSLSLSFPLLYKLHSLSKTLIPPSTSLADLFLSPIPPFHPSIYPSRPIPPSRRTALKGLLASIFFFISNLQSLSGRLRHSRPLQNAPLEGLQFGQHVPRSLHSSLLRLCKARSIAPLLR